MSINVYECLRRYTVTFVAVILFTAMVLGTFSGHAFADYPKLSNRKLVLGTTEPGAITTYTFSWSFPNNTSARSVRFQLCDDPIVDTPCSSTPPGDMSGAVLTDQQGTVTGFSVLSTSADEIIITRPTAPAGIGQSTYEFSNVVNPTGLPTKFYVRLYTYPTADASGPATYMSSVVQATTMPINITSIVPPILYFCVGLNITPWCANATGNYIDYGSLRDDTTRYGTSQFGVATNADGGYAVTVNGTTMIAGNKVIDALTVPTANQIGVPQFGINLRANTDPATGSDVSGIGTGTVSANYDTPDLYMYGDGDLVASAVTGTMFDTFTATYIVNIPTDQPSGIYNTTITYICTAAF